MGSLTKNGVVGAWIILCLTFGIGVSAANTLGIQDSLASAPEKWRLFVAAGTQIGGAAPLGMPREIRKINSYAPAVPYYFSATLSRSITERWGIASGLTIGGKGMHTEAQVKGYQTSFQTGDSPVDVISGYYYGAIKTRVQMHYLTLPLHATYRLHQRWELHGGAYISIALKKRFTGEAVSGYIRNESPLGEKKIIQNTPYDFSEYLHRADFGFQLGTQYQLTSTCFMRAQLDYGMSNIMQNSFQSISFAMHNVYMQVGFAVRIK